MKGALTEKPNYRFDENGNLVPEKDETEEQLFTRQTIALHKEGFSPNHPADVAVSNDPSAEVPPEALAAPGKRAPKNETEEERAEREKKEQEESTEADKKKQEQSLKGTKENPDRTNPPMDPSQANDSNDPAFARQTPDEIEENDMEEVEEEKKTPGYRPLNKPTGRRGR